MRPQPLPSRVPRQRHLSQRLPRPRPQTAQAPEHPAVPDPLRRQSAIHLPHLHRRQNAPQTLDVQSFPNTLPAPHPALRVNFPRLRHPTPTQDLEAILPVQHHLHRPPLLRTQQQRPMNLYLLHRNRRAPPRLPQRLDPLGRIQRPRRQHLPMHPVLPQPTRILPGQLPLEGNRPRPARPRRQPSSGCLSTRRRFGTSTQYRSRRNGYVGSDTRRRSSPANNPPKEIPTPAPYAPATPPSQTPPSLPDPGSRPPPGPPPTANPATPAVPAPPSGPTSTNTPAPELRQRPHRRARNGPPPPPDDASTPPSRPPSTTRPPTPPDQRNRWRRDLPHRRLELVEHRFRQRAGIPAAPSASAPPAPPTPRKPQAAPRPPPPDRPPRSATRCRPPATPIPPMTPPPAPQKQTPPPSRRPPAAPPSAPPDAPQTAALPPDRTPPPPPPPRSLPPRDRTPRPDALPRSSTAPSTRSPTQTAPAASTPSGPAPPRPRTSPGGARFSP